MSFKKNDEFIEATRCHAWPVATHSLNYRMLFCCTDNGLLKFNLTFDVTPRMSGSLKVLVFTILPNGETVADSMLITVETCFHNQASLGVISTRYQLRGL